MANGEAVKEEKGVIWLQIQYAEPGREQHKLRFSTYRDVELRRIFLDFCYSLGLVYSTITFRFEGKHIKDTQSADVFGLEDGDVIDAFNTQDGGGVAAAARIFLQN
ncbi:hypothetical protein ACS0TY_005063 [Phlomoides rotata]